MKFEEAKDQVAKESGWENITDLFVNESLNTSINVIEKAAELYARSMAAQAWEEQEGIIKGLRTRIEYDRNEIKQKLFKIESLLDEYSEYLPTSFTQAITGLIKNN